MPSTARPARSSGTTRNRCPQNLALCCDAVNRGFAAWDDRLYMATLDAHLVCLDRNTGEEVWDIPITVAGEDGKEVGDIYKMAYSATVAPLAVKGKIIIGISGAEYGIRGFIDAYDAKTGKRLWRFFTVPGADDKSEHAQKARATWEGNSWLTGGGSAWVTGTYDPELNTFTGASATPRPTSTAKCARAITSTPARSSPSTQTTAPISGISRTALMTSGTMTASTSRAGRHQPSRQADQGAGSGAPQRLLLLPEPRER